MTHSYFPQEEDPLSQACAGHNVDSPVPAGFGSGLALETDGCLGGGAVTQTVASRNSALGGAET